MTNRIAIHRCLRLNVAAAALLAAGIGLAGCSGVGDSFASGAFADPAMYDLYDCKQLESERKSLVAQTESQQKLIDKARTGVAGSVVGEVAYRNDYIRIRAQAKMADDMWRRNKCEDAASAAAAAAAAAAPASGTAPAAPRKPLR